MNRILIQQQKYVSIKIVTIREGEIYITFVIEMNKEAHVSGLYKDV
jgi:hypothetical protein